MQKVIPITLQGHSDPFELDEDGYESIRRYLDHARARLSAHPEPDENVGRLEQSLGDSLISLRDDSTDRGLFGVAEVQQALRNVGELDLVEATSTVGDELPGRRRLVRIKEGQWFAGVATGLAAYGDFELAWVRTLLVAFSLFTGGGLAVVYVVMAFALPVVPTYEDYVALCREAAGA